MLRFLTRFILLLLIVAVPLQGANAAAMMAKEVLGGHSPTQVTAQSHDADDAVVMASADGDDDDCLAHSNAAPVESAGKSAKHAGHACSGCAACALCSVVPFSFPLSIHLDDSMVRASFSLNVGFASHIPDALQRPPAFRV